MVAKKLYKATGIGSVLYSSGNYFPCLNFNYCIGRSGTTNKRDIECSVCRILGLKDHYRWQDKWVSKSITVMWYCLWIWLGKLYCGFVFYDAWRWFQILFFFTEKLFETRNLWPDYGNILAKCFQFQLWSLETTYDILLDKWVYSISKLVKAIKKKA